MVYTSECEKKANCIIKTFENITYVTALKNIEKDSELLTDYGPAYWASEVDNKTFKEKIESCGKNKRKPLEKYWNFE